MRATAIVSKLLMYGVCMYCVRVCVLNLKLQIQMNASEAAVRAGRKQAEASGGSCLSHSGG